MAMMGVYIYEKYVHFSQPCRREIGRLMVLLSRRVEIRGFVDIMFSCLIKEHQSLQMAKSTQET